MNKIKILVIPSDRMGVGKFRSVDPHVYIAEHYADEFDIDICYIDQIPTENTKNFFAQYDLVHIHKQLDNDMLLMNMLKELSIPVVLDIDDYFHLSDFHPMVITARKEKWHEKIINHIRKADYVTTTTDIYAKTLRKYNQNVSVFPNAINTDEKQYTYQKNESDKIRFGIVCGSSHLHDIQLLKGISECARPDNNVQLVLCGFDTNGTRTIYDEKTGQVYRRKILPQESMWFEYERIITDDYKYCSQEHKNFLMKFVPGVDDPFVNEPYRRMWTRSINSYATHYQNIDVLLAPLKDTEFNKMKSELKEIECGFTKTALIAENLGPYTINLTSMIGFGGTVNKNGTALLVDPRKDHKDWFKYINKLATNPEMIEKLKDNIHSLVVDKYSMDKVCEDRVKFYKEIMKNKKRDS